MGQAELRAAIRKMIQVELDARHYYLKAIEAMQDEGAISHFTLLAAEELEHARSFYQIYPGEELPPFERMLTESTASISVIKSIDIGLMARLDERQALQLAMRLEKELEGNLRIMASGLKSAEARAVIEKNAESTLGHYEMIAADYARLYENAAE